MKNIFLMVYDLGFTVFDIFLALYWYKQNVLWASGIFIFLAVIMFVCFVVSSILLAKDY